MGQASAQRHLEWGLRVTVSSVSARHCMCPACCWGRWADENHSIESRVCPPSEKVPFLFSPLWGPLDVEQLLMHLIKWRSDRLTCSLLPQKQAGLSQA